MRVPLVCTLTPSIKLNDPVVTKLAPTPLAPLLYVITPLVTFANVSGVAACEGACMCKPCATVSTYCLVAASVAAIDSAIEVMLKLPTSS